MKRQVLHPERAHLNRCSASNYKRDRFPTFATTLNSFIDIIHSTENKTIKEGMTSLNSNNKSFHVASNFAAICMES